MPRATLPVNFARPPAVSSFFFNFPTDAYSICHELPAQAFPGVQWVITNPTSSLPALSGGSM